MNTKPTKQFFLGPQHKIHNHDTESASIIAHKLKHLAVAT